MKKIISLVLVCLMICCFTACNYIGLDTHYDFNYAYINYGDHTEKVSIKTWSEDETSFTITTTSGTVICSHQSNIILVKE